MIDNKMNFFFGWKSRRFYWNSRNYTNYTEFPTNACSTIITSEKTWGAEPKTNKPANLFNNKMVL